MSKSKEIKPEKWAEPIKKALLAELLAVGEHLVGIIQRNAPVATNALAGSFVVTGAQVTGGVGVQVGSPMWGPPRGYGSYVEFGTRPHWAPIAPLIRWVREKGLAKLSVDVSFKSGTAKRVRGQTTKSYQERKIESIAYAIRAKIAKEGTKEQRFVLKALEAMGLPFKVVKGKTEWYYAINPVPFLKRRGAWARIMAAR